jgi:hypothetical protein
MEETLGDGTGGRSTSHGSIFIDRDSSILTKLIRGSTMIAIPFLSRRRFGQIRGSTS